MAVSTTQAKWLGGIMGHGTVVSGAITEADTNATTNVIEIPSGVFVEKVWLIVTEAFAGGTPSIDVGETGNDDAWVDTTDVTETSIGVYHGSSADAVRVAATTQGAYYATGTFLTAKLSASLSDGTAYVVAECRRVP